MPLPQEGGVIPTRWLSSPWYSDSQLGWFSLQGTFANVWEHLRLLQYWGGWQEMLLNILGHTGWPYNKEHHIPGSWTGCQILYLGKFPCIHFPPYITLYSALSGSNPICTPSISASSYWLSLAAIFRNIKSLTSSHRPRTPPARFFCDSTSGWPEGKCRQIQRRMCVWSYEKRPPYCF